MREIYLAGGCFWGLEAYFKKIKGVTDTTVGYANGITEDATYKEVCSGATLHAETVHLVYDENVVTLTELLRIFFKIIDPTTMNRQAGDVGTQYRSGIYYTDDKDLHIINDSLSDAQQKIDKPIVTEVMPLSIFLPAEEYHQDYLDKNPDGYCHIDLHGIC